MKFGSLHQMHCILENATDVMNGGRATIANKKILKLLQSHW